MPDGVGRNKPHPLKIFCGGTFQNASVPFPPLPHKPKTPPTPPGVHVHMCCTCVQASTSVLLVVEGACTTFPPSQVLVLHGPALRVMTSQNPSVHGLDFTSNQAQDVISDQLEELYLTH